MTEDEKEIIIKSNASKAEETAADSAPGASGSGVCHLYLLAFCVHNFGYALIWYNTLNVIPFYLNQVLGASPLLIASLNTFLCILIAVCTIVFSVLYQKLDKVMSWDECRMILTVLPMVCQIIFAIGMSFSNTVTGGVIILSFCAIASSTYFSGGLVTLNYELDPDNSALKCSIFNSFGQMAGFVGPLLMAAITNTPPDTPNYAEVYKQRWSFFFFVVAGIAAVSSLVIVLAYFLKRDEWVPFKDRNRVE